MFTKRIKEFFKPHIEKAHLASEKHRIKREEKNAN